jgi:hypothetical protein
MPAQSQDFSVTLSFESAIPLQLIKHTPGSSGGNANAASFSRELERPKASDR